MHSLLPPTPPYSPPPHTNHLPPPPDDPLRSTAILLDNLIASYQYRRMWVCRTRASLEEEGLPQSSSEPLSHPVEETDQNTYQDAAGEQDSRPSSTSRWSKRKRGFKLPRLEGLSSKPRRIIPAMQPADGGNPYPQLPPPTREDILSMYERMVESRMESCQRINKLIQEANRAKLQNR